jgi:hypothetical protein
MSRKLKQLLDNLQISIERCVDSKNIITTSEIYMGKI